MRRKVIFVFALALGVANAKPQTVVISYGGHKRTLTVHHGHRVFHSGDRFHFNGEVWTVLR